MKTARILSGLLGFVLLILGVQWIIDPQAAAEGLALLYFEGEGRNTLIRDFTAFFLGTSLMCFLGLLTKNYQYMVCVAIIFVIALVANIYAGVAHGAPMIVSAAISELIFSIMAITSALLMKSNNN